MITRFGSLWLAVTLALALGTAAACAADLNVVSGPDTARVLTELAPRIEGLTQRRLVVEIAAPGTLARAQSEPFDAVVVYEVDAVALLQRNHLVDRLYCIGWTRQGPDLVPIYAAVGREAKEPAAAQRLVAFLSSFEGLTALTAHGLEGTPNE
jgi:ABC-type molybdate transport system substrate-binding protein